MRIIWLKHTILVFSIGLLVGLPFTRALAQGITSDAVIDLVNRARVDRNIQPLVESSALDRVAQEKAQDMFAKNYFAHTSPDGVTPWHWFDDAGYVYTVAGENLAINFTDVIGQHNAWMQSPTHQKNILNQKYREIGVAVVQGKMNGAQTTITVQEFGSGSYVPTAAQLQTIINNVKNEEGGSSQAQPQSAAPKNTRAAAQQQVDGIASYAVQYRLLALSIAMVLLLLVLITKGKIHLLDHGRLHHFGWLHPMPAHASTGFGNMYRAKMYLTHMKMRK